MGLVGDASPGAEVTSSICWLFPGPEARGLGGEGWPVLHLRRDQVWVVPGTLAVRQEHSDLRAEGNRP